MKAMAPTRPTELQVCRIRLTASPVAAGEARGRVRAAIRAWDIPVDEDIAVLLTSELVTNAISHEAGTTIMLSVTSSFGQLRVDVHDTSRTWPRASPAAAGLAVSRTRQTCSSVGRVGAIAFIGILIGRGPGVVLKCSVPVARK